MLGQRESREAGPLAATEVLAARSSSVPTHRLRHFSGIRGILTTPQVMELTAKAISVTARQERTSCFRFRWARLYVTSLAPWSLISSPRVRRSLLSGADVAAWVMQRS